MGLFFGSSNIFVTSLRFLVYKLGSALLGGFLSGVRTLDRRALTATAAWLFGWALWGIICIVLAIVALVLAKKSGDEIAASGGRVGGEGLNTATKVVAWINIGLYAAVFLIFGAIFLIAVVLGAASGTTS